MNDRKMAGKQNVVGSFDLEKFVNAADQGSVSDIEPPTQEIDAEKTNKATNKSRFGRNARNPEKPRLSERVQVKISEDEMSKLQEKAGLVPLSAFVRQHMKETGLI